MSELAADIRTALRPHADPARAEQEKAYLKSDLAFLGVTLPTIRRVTKEVARAHPGLDRDDIRSLWRDDDVWEHRAAAVELLTERGALLSPDDLPLLEELLRTSYTWALVDSLAATVVGGLLERHPEAIDVLDRWIVDDDMWVQRSALLALLGPLRRGDGDFDRFARYADPLLEDTRFFIRKAIGWVLRDTSRKRPGLVYEWCLPRADRMSGVTYREAVKRLTPAQREKLDAVRAG